MGLVYTKCFKVGISVVQLRNSCLLEPKASQNYIDRFHIYCVQVFFVNSMLEEG